MGTTTRRSANRKDVFIYLVAHFMSVNGLIGEDSSPPLLSENQKSYWVDQFQHNLSFDINRSWVDIVDGEKQDVGHELEEKEKGQNTNNNTDDDEADDADMNDDETQK